MKIKPIYILVDCDVDGYTSASIMYLTLKNLGHDNIKFILHDKFAKAHGLTDRQVFEQIKELEPSLLIIPDAGTNDIKECKELKELGFDILILDHHDIEVENPYATIVSSQAGRANRNACGAMVTWMFCRRINQSISKSLVSYVMLGSIADSMSFADYENQTFGYWGKKSIHHNLKKMIDFFNKENESNKAYSFGCISKINATIRLGALEDKQRLLKAMVGEDDFDEVNPIMKKWHEKQTRDCKRIADDIIKKIKQDNNEDKYIFEEIERTPLTGLVAGRIAGYTKKPTILYSNKDGICGGSVRSEVEGFRNILENSGLFISALGHSNVFGHQFNNTNRELIKNFLDTSVAFSVPREDVWGSYSVENIPSEIYSFKSAYTHIYGKKLEEPIIHIKRFALKGSDIVELGANKTTIKFVKHGIEFIMFFASEKKEELKVGKNETYLIEIIGVPDINEFRGVSKNQVIIEKYEVIDNIEDLF